MKKEKKREREKEIEKFPLLANRPYVAMLPETRRI